MRKIYQSIALVGLVLAASCSGGNDGNAENTGVSEKPIVKLAEVNERPVAQVQEFTATVEAEVVNNIAPQLSVRIDRILVEVGDRVRKGQKLVIMDEANLRQAALQLDNRTKEFERIDELYKVGGVSRSDWEAMKTSLDVQTTAYKNLKENTALLSPIDGVVTARNYDNGDMYAGREPVLVVQQICPVKLMVNVSELYYTRVKKGSKVDVQLDVYGEEKFPGKVSLVYPVVNPETRTFQVEISLDNRDQRVRPGMFARAMMNFGEVNNVVIPDLAVIKQAGSGDRYVYVYRDGKVYYNKVELGRRMGNEYELKTGVSANAMVVVAGQTRLQDGIEVEVHK